MTREEFEAALDAALVAHDDACHTGSPEHLETFLGKRSAVCALHTTAIERAEQLERENSELRAECKALAEDDRGARP